MVRRLSSASMAAFTSQVGTSWLAAPPANSASAASAAFLRLGFAVNHLGDLKGQHTLGLVDLLAGRAPRRRTSSMGRSVSRLRKRSTS